MERKVDQHETLLAPKSPGELHSEGGRGKLGGAALGQKVAPEGARRGASPRVMMESQLGVCVQLRERPSQGKAQDRRKTWSAAPYSNVKQL